MIAATPAAFIFSTSALPPSGVDWASPGIASSFEPPRALIPPAPLMSSIAIIAPIRPCWPEYDRAPDTGCSTPILTAAPWARNTAGAPATPAAIEIAPDAELCRNWRRLQFTRSFSITDAPCCGGSFGCVLAVRGRRPAGDNVRAQAMPSPERPTQLYLLLSTIQNEKAERESMT